jgi:hypothetical protein
MGEGSRDSGFTFVALERGRHSRASHAPENHFGLSKDSRINRVPVCLERRRGQMVFFRAS